MAGKLFRLWKCLMQTHEEKLQFLKEELKRDVTISGVRVKGQSGFMVDYINANAPATKLVGASEEEAVDLLFTYLNEKKIAAAPLPEPEIAAPTKG